MYAQSDYFYILIFQLVTFRMLNMYKLLTDAKYESLDQGKDVDDDGK